MLHNDFARGLRDLKERIDKIPHLVVMSASDSEGRKPVPPPGSAQAPAAVPEGLVSAVVNLVNTGPVELGAYTVAATGTHVSPFQRCRPSAERVVTHPWPSQ